MNPFVAFFDAVLCLAVACVFVWIASVVMMINNRKGSRQKVEAFAEARKEKLNAAAIADYEASLVLINQDVVCNFQLDEDEHALYRDAATLKWDTDYEMTSTGTAKAVSKTTGGGLGAVIGGVALGPVGAIAGYRLSRKTTTTTQVSSGGSFTVNKVLSESGILTITSKRLVFIGDGNTTIVTPLADIIRIEISRTKDYDLGKNYVLFRRAKTAVKGERFVVSNEPYFALAMRRAGHIDIPEPIKPQPHPSASR